MKKTEILQQDAAQVVCGADLSPLNGKTVFITGATGLIGGNIVRALRCAKQRGISVRVLALVRSVERAEALLGQQDAFLSYIIGDVSKLPDVEGPVDYIIHAASQTGSKAFVEQPVDTISTALGGTAAVLELARQKNSAGLVYLSSMEVYGAPQTDERITELHGTDLNTMAVRSCYPESKRMCESLCSSYASQYSVPAKVIRLTQTFGPGVKYNDGRVFAEFVRCALEGRDIVLHTKGETKRSYLYTADAAAAILTVLLYGTEGEAYNAANESSYCSILEMAELAAKTGDKPVNVIVEAGDGAGFGYAPVLHMNLDTAKLQSLGWKAQTGLEEMYRRMMTCMEKN